MSEAGWRLMRTEDVPAANALADAIHFNHPERPEVMVERQRLAGGFCFVLAHGGELGGYLVSHPWAGLPPALDSLLGGLPDVVEHHYIHDLALAPGFRRGGWARLGLAMLGATAAGGMAMRLVAVGGSSPFWAAQGFAAMALPAAKLASYGGDAVYMQKPAPAGG